VTDMPFEDQSYDLVCAFDVIEHVEDDTLAIQEINRVLKKGGVTFTTVPAFRFLWGDHDIINHHYRRYTSTSYKQLFSVNKITSSYLNYFNFWLFLPIAIVRVSSRILKGSKNQNGIKSSDNEGINSNKIIGAVLGYIFKSEKYLIHKNVRLPFGVSIIHIGQKH
jgi:ubiquinone/menaquinone biosynthesis C-methylase UbiE